MLIHQVKITQQFPDGSWPLLVNPLACFENFLAKGLSAEVEDFIP